MLNQCCIIYIYIEYIDYWAPVQATKQHISQCAVDKVTVFLPSGNTIKTFKIIQTIQTKHQISHKSCNHKSIEHILKTMAHGITNHQVTMPSFQKNTRECPKSKSPTFLSVWVWAAGSLSRLHLRFPWFQQQARFWDVVGVNRLGGFWVQPPTEGSNRILQVDLCGSFFFKQLV